MRIFAILTLQVLLSMLFFLPAFALDHSHNNWDKVLKSYQSEQGLVNYKKLQADAAAKPEHELSQYLQEIQAVSYASYQKFSDQEKMAFLINAYNALTIKLIIDHYPVKSIRNIGGMFTKPWSIEFFSLLDGKIKKIDPIEHEWLRPMFKDYRIHAAVNCASISCPPLRNEAFIAARLDAQLDEQMRDWLKDPNRTQLDRTAKVFKVSKIFDWYKKDFIDWGGGLSAVVNKYIDNPLSAEDLKKVKVQFMSYDWNLNETK